MTCVSNTFFIKMTSIYNIYLKEALQCSSNGHYIEITAEADAFEVFSKIFVCNIIHSQK